MRQWFLPPILLCKDHLLGNHFEIHKHRHNFIKKHNMRKRLAYPSQIDPKLMKEDHDNIVKEMLRRGYNHNSPYEQPDVSYLDHLEVKVDLDYNIQDLMERCPTCKKRIEKFFMGEKYE